jgi:hypothetical protein
MKMKTLFIIAAIALVLAGLFAGISGLRGIEEHSEELRESR